MTTRLPAPKATDAAARYDRIGGRTPDIRAPSIFSWRSDSKRLERLFRRHGLGQRRPNLLLLDVVCGRVPGALRTSSTLRLLTGDETAVLQSLRLQTKLNVIAIKSKVGKRCARISSLRRLKPRRVHLPVAASWLDLVSSRMAQSQARPDPFPFDATEPVTRRSARACSRLTPQLHPTSLALVRRSRVARIRPSANSRLCASPGLASSKAAY
jgi:hypothetical protein